MCSSCIGRRSRSLKGRSPRRGGCGPRPPRRAGSSRSGRCATRRLHRPEGSRCSFGLAWRCGCRPGCCAAWTRLRTRALQRRHGPGTRAPGCRCRRWALAPPFPVGRGGRASGLPLREGWGRNRRQRGSRLHLQRQDPHLIPVVEQRFGPRSSSREQLKPLSADQGSTAWARCAFEIPTDLVSRHRRGSS